MLYVPVRACAKPRGDLVITIDGPAGSGKSTKAKILAHELSLRVLDTGATYRALALAVLNRSADPSDGDSVRRILKEVEIAMKWQGNSYSVLLDGQDVSEAIRSPDVSTASSLIAVHPQVRAGLVDLQRRLAGKGVVAEGRDAGSVVFPDADFKVYLDASPEERARRRWKEYRQKGVDISFEDVLEAVRERDSRDKNRQDSPLKPPDGAFILDTEHKTIEQQIELILHEMEKKLGPAYKQKKRWTFGWFVTWPLWYLVFGLRVIGRDNIPKGPCILAGNHTTMWDPPLMGAAAKREVFYLAKEDLFRIKPFAWLIRFFNALEIKRDAGAKKAFEQALDVLSRGGCVVIYPEGTRNKTQRPLADFKLGPAKLAQLSGAPVIPCFATRHKTPFRPLRWMLRKPRLTYRFGPALWPQNYPDNRRGMLQLTKELKASMLKLGGYGED